MIKIGNDLIILHDSDRKDVPDNDYPYLWGFNFNILDILDMGIIVYLNDNYFRIMKSKYNIYSVGMQHNINYPLDNYGDFLLTYYIAENQRLPFEFAVAQMKQMKKEKYAKI